MDFEGSGSDDPNGGRLRLIATTDVHVSLLPQDYFRETPAPQAPCLARLAPLIHAARAAADAAGAACLLLDNGDFLQGTPMADAGLAAETPHPAITAMNTLAYDAATPGNHEFNFGLAVLARELARAAFPLVATNLRLAPRHRALARLLPPHVILDRRISRRPDLPPLRIGLLGFVPPQILQWDRPHLEGEAEVADIADAAPAAIAALRAAGADCVVAMCHSGLAAPGAPYHPEAAGAHLAALPGVDAVICGHGHLTFPPDSPARPQARVDPLRGLVCGTPLVMPGANGSHLGLIDLQFHHDGRRWHHAGGQGRLCAPAADAPADLALLAALGPDHDRTRRFVRRRVGHSADRLHSHFALLGRSSALSLIAAAQTGAVAAALADLGREGAPPILSAVAPFKAGGRGGPGHFIDIPPGDLHLSHVADLYIFPNDLAAVEVTGAELREWLEHGASIFARLPRHGGGPPLPLIDPEFPAYNSDMIHGLDFAIDLSRPARYDRHGLRINDGAGRIGTIRYQGRPVGEGDRFVLATNSYRLSGSGGYLPDAPGRGLPIRRISLRDVLARHIGAQDRVEAPATAVFRLTAPPGSRAWIDTGPAAVDLLDQIADLPHDSAGITAEGFLRLVLRF